MAIRIAYEQGKTDKLLETGGFSEFRAMRGDACFRRIGEAQRSKKGRLLEKLGERLTEIFRKVRVGYSMRIRMQRHVSRTRTKPMPRTQKDALKESTHSGGLYKFPKRKRQPLRTGKTTFLNTFRRLIKSNSARP